MSLPAVGPKKEALSGLSDIRFRSPDSVGIVIIQCFMIMAAALVVAGLFYVAIVMILIIVHHFMYDRDPRAVPPYVRRALQFDSDTDSEVDESGGRNKKETKIVEIEVEESGNYEDTSDFSSHKARKMGNMDKFLGKDIDVSR